MSDESRTSALSAQKLPEISAAQLREWLLDGDELALLDVSEAHHHVRGHIVVSRNLPLSQLALLAPSLLPRSDVRIVLFSADEHEQVWRAAAQLRHLGYSNISELAGGQAAWVADGGLLIDGYNALVKGFGERVRRHYGVPSISTHALEKRLESGESTTVVDVRTPAEHQFSTLPGAINIQGVEWPLRDVSGKAPGHLWAVHCFSRTRGVLGTANLRLLHGPDVPAAWVDDGVMQWVVEGREDAQQTPVPDALPPLDDADAVRHARTLVERHALPVATLEDVEQWLHQGERTVQVFDVRPGAVSRAGITAISGGQLLMHFENLVAVRNARLVLVDEPNGLRAALTSFWTNQLGEADVHILDVAAEDTLPRLEDLLKPRERYVRFQHDAAGLKAAQLAALVDDGRALVVDVGPSLEYLRARLPGAQHANASRIQVLEKAFADARAGGRLLVLTSPDGDQARVVASLLLDALHANPQAETGIVWLRGGTQAWKALDLPFESGAVEAARQLTPYLDDWGSIMRVPREARLAVWERYLRWERAVADRIAGEPSVRFRLAEPHALR